MVGEIVVVYGDTETRVDPGAIVGRERGADVVLPHPDISRRHAEISHGGEGLEIRDLGSTNGIWAAGAKRISIPLSPGLTRVCFGPKDSAPFIDIKVAEPAPPPAPTVSATPAVPRTQDLGQGMQTESLPVSGTSKKESKPKETQGRRRRNREGSERKRSKGQQTPKVVEPLPGQHPRSSPARQALGASAASEPAPGSLNAANLAGNLGELSQVFQTATKKVLIGRSQKCDLVVQDPLVSRRHAELTITSPTSARIVDLGTDNGTYVNGLRIKEKDIVDGDLVEMGRTQLVLRQGKLEQHVAYGLPLQASNLSVVIDKQTHILSDVSFTLPAGSLTAIIGPSGSGKTTLLNALTSRRRADIGSVFLGGRNIYDRASQVSQRIGFVPQNDPVHNNLTVRYALTAAAKMRLPQDTSPEEIQRAVLRIADELGLSERLGVQVKDLSGGQRKRVSVGYELVGEPQALILDEPTSGLDPGLERELMTSLRELANKGTTTIVVTHSVQSVELCDQVLVLAPGGRLAFVGPPAKAIAHFEVPDLASVFTLLSSKPKAEWERHFAETTSFFRFVTSAPSASVDVSTPRSRRSFTADLATLVGRYVRLLAGDKRRLIFLGVQAPLLGLLLALVLNRRAFDTEALSAGREYAVAMVLAITLIGVLNSVREIVQDRPTFRREFAVGVSSAAFVLSRWLVLVGIVVVQSLVLFLLTVVRQQAPLKAGVLVGAGSLELLAALIGIGVASVGLGLVVSSFVSDTPKALTAFPLIVIPAMLLSGLVIPTSARVGVEQLTYLNPIQWGSSAAASVLDLPAGDGCDLAGVRRVNLPSGLVGEDEIVEDPDQSLSPACSNSRWSRTAGSQALNFFVQFGANIGLLCLAIYGTRRSLKLPSS